MSPRLGIRAEQTFAACKFTNLNRDDPNYLSSTLIIRDETTHVEVKFVLVVVKGQLQNVYIANCGRGLPTFEDTIAFHERMVEMRPDIQMMCIENLDPDRLLDFATREIFEEALGDQEDTKKAISGMMAQCLGI